MNFRFLIQTYTDVTKGKKYHKPLTNRQGKSFVTMHHSTKARLFFGVIITILWGFGTASASNHLIYEDSLGAGWVNWSWNTSLDMNATSPVHTGVHAIAVTYTDGWGALFLHQNSSIDLSSFAQLSFWVHGGFAGDVDLRVVVNGDDNTAVLVKAVSNTWSQVTIALSTLGNPSALTDIYWQDTTGNSQSTFYLDEIQLIEQTGPPPSDPKINIDVSAGRHLISADIYGMNFASEQLANDVLLPVRRWGGNSTSRYNWQNNTSNRGSDWFFENIPEYTAPPGNLPDGSVTDAFIEQDRRTTTKTLMTVPLIGWTPKRRTPGHPYDCGFKVSLYGSQQAVDPWDNDCGNGILPDGSLITGNNPLDTSIAIDPSFISAWINHLVGKYNSAAHGGVAFYNLDNEPMLWNSTHRDVHPLPTSYDEIRDRTYQYAAAIKATDSSAMTLGPAVWGWCAYFYSSVDNCLSSGSDYQAHGSIPFIPWYLQQMQLYEHLHGQRILDYVDLHIYPQINGVFSDDLGSASVQSARLRSTRQLWDPSYVHEGWINQPVYLIPRMKEWVNSYYPGTKTAITEYNWGALGYMNGALAQADILGIFGREGLDLATLWGPPAPGTPGAFAFLMYRNYDEAGSSFGDISTLASSSDQEKLSVYAAQQSADNTVTIIVINKTSSNLISSIHLSGYSPDPKASVYRYSSANLHAIEHLPDQELADNKLSSTFPGNSITLFVLKPVNGALPGDTDGNGVVDLEDAIRALQILSGSEFNGNILSDSNDDGRIGLAEVIYILKKLGASGR